MPHRNPLRTLLAALLLAPLVASAQTHNQTLDQNWRFRAVDSADHRDTTTWHQATVPGVVQTDLHHAGLIPDPFFADNEKRLQWIGLTDWEYTDDFDVSPETLRSPHQQLVFDGLDTYADVTLNGTPILSADNQFRTWRVDVKPYLHPGRNTLRILLHSPTNRWTPIVAKLPYLIPGTGYEPLDRANGIYPVSHYMRKAPYSYGWDWGPKFVTLGIWKPIHLDTWSDARIESFHLQQRSVTASRALIEAQLQLLADTPGNATLRLHITAPDGKPLPVRTLPVTLDRGENTIAWPLRLDNPARWYPNGYGPQSRYTLRVELLRNTTPLAQAELKTGLRSIELQRKPDQWGKSFTFVVNGIPIFAKGANFVPMDSFAPSITDQRRRALLTAARDVHMNMLRIWGGGGYEADSFYDLCDELGLMVWHDFMFGGALVPGDEAFQTNVRAEAIEQVSRLSDHPSLVLWCGNNEVETGWRNWGDRLDFEKSITPQQRERVWQDYVVLFRDILKSVVAQHGNGVPYWPSSPGSDFDDVPAGQQDGDMHSWSVWSGAAPVATYAKDHPRFLSEFGFQALPDLATVRAFAGNDEDLSSPALQNHERFIHGFDRMTMYLDADFKPAKDLPSFVYLSQLKQAEAIKFAVETMRSREPETMGTLYWQLDDCWPVASWSSIDYYGRWKALHYYAARFYAPLLIVAEPRPNGLTVHLVSDEQQPQQATLHTRLMRFDGTLLDESRTPVTAAPLTSTALPDIALKSFDPHTAFAVLTLERNGHTLAANTVYFATPRDLALPAATIEHTLRPETDGYALTLSSPVLARAVALSFGDAEAKPADNDVDLLPHEPRTIHIASKATLETLQKQLQIRSLADATR